MLWRPMVLAIASTIGYCATTCSRRWCRPRARIESLRHAADRLANVPKARPYSLLRVGESEGVSPSAAA
ncbi:MAG: hypothetical protein K2M49_01425 [Muribaculaceae bacterium]|nr:hypothetical protein [Muribaculaceae bacterium]